MTMMTLCKAHLLAVHLRVHGAEEVRHVPRVTVCGAGEAAGPGLGPQLPRGGLHLVQVVVTVPAVPEVTMLTLSCSLFPPSFLTGGCSLAGSR